MKTNMRPIRVLISLGLCLVAWLGYQCLLKTRGQQNSRVDEQGYSLREAIQRAPSVTIYGKVVDTKEQPIEGAKATITVRRLEVLLKQSYHENLSALTDANGEFHITADKPYDAFVKTVVKEGYVFERDVESTLDIINHRKSSPENPHLLRMRKLGIPELILVVGSGRLLHAFAGESRSSKWSVTNLRSYNSFWSDVRDLAVTARFDEEKKDWEITYRVLLQHGGLVLSNQDLYMAPEAGYQQEVSFRTGRIGTDARSRDSRYYLYLKTRNPTLYSKFDIDQVIGLPSEYPQSFLDISAKSWTNPYGGRNFEPLQPTQENWLLFKEHTRYCLQCINEGRRADPKHLADLLAKPAASP